MFINVAEAAKVWNISERTVRHYCESGRVDGAILEKGVWKIPADAQKPIRKKRTIVQTGLLQRLLSEKNAQRHGGVYHMLQIEFAYNSNHIEGSKLTKDETKYIFETSTVGIDGPARVDDVIETVNHFRCFDYVLDTAHNRLTETYIKNIHRLLKSSTQSANTPEAVVGNYKKLQNYVGDIQTSSPEMVRTDMQVLLRDYSRKEKTFDVILDFHATFERIHPFYDGNGRVGRLIMFKECLCNGIIPFVIRNDNKAFYYRGLKEWQAGGEQGYLRDTCLLEQDNTKRILDYFQIQH